MTRVVGGLRTFEQWKDYYGDLATQIDADDEWFLDQLVALRHPDPVFSVTSRAV
ncbi:MAG: hypothetical protein O3B03_06685 [Proteobacteria bacterium]|nr:hypothetical protein [Pseudomonadota bacterium]MDA1330980.1 hypothetical protein [Pseudomonadota bacterium]